MRCALIGSGSSGNATLVSHGATTLLVDCGYSIRAFEERAAALAFDPGTLAAILVTHEHDDHVGGVDALARKYEIPVYATRGTRVATEMRAGPLAHWQQISPHTAFQIGELAIQPVPVPHDAREPSQFIFIQGEARLGILTDVGSLTPHVVAQYQTCRSLVLEFNHDPALLAASAYPARLKRRIAGDYGHFSNLQSQNLLKAMQPAQLRRVVAAHLSERTNHPDIVANCLQHAALDALGFEWSIAAQDQVLPWFEV
jgi:phosphoribosyl 1,2-cyclic phosphodiesterase